MPRQFEPAIASESGLKSISFSPSQQSLMRCARFTRCASDALSRSLCSDMQKIDMPFLVVTPLGLPSASRFSESLTACGVKIASRSRVLPWSALSIAIYAKPRVPQNAASGLGNGEPRATDDHYIRKAWAYSEIWKRLYPEDVAEQWIMADMESYERLLSMKKILRGFFPSVRMKASMPGFNRRLSLHIFHLPDPGRIGYENGVLDQEKPDIY